MTPAMKPETCYITMLNEFASKAVRRGVSREENINCVKSFDSSI